MNKVYNISGIGTDKATRSTDYKLLPTNLVPPSIISQIIANVYQFTWLNADNEFKNFYPTDNNIDIVEGTEFMMSIYAIDPSNLTNVYDNINLSYVWKRDGTPIFGINSLNNNKGLNVIYIKQANCVKDLSGTYTVEVSNAYGTTVSDGFTVNIFKPLEHPMLYKNLILNSSGEQGLDNWITDNDIKTDCFERGLYENQNYGSFNFRLNEPLYSSTTQPIFRFGTGYNWNSFNEAFTKIQSGSTPNQFFNPAFPASLIFNENKLNTPLASFFPDPDWIDKYNKNTNVLTLKEELESSNTYFTRDSVKFNKFGGQSSVKASQIIDLTTILDYVDGNVYGVDQLVGQLFAYIGIGLSRYKFKVPYVVDGQTVPAETNFFIYNKGVYGDLGSDLNSRGPASIFFPEGGLDESVPIELIPYADDNTTVYLEYIDVNDIVIYSKTLTGPTAEDVFAVKEKFYIPKFIEQPITKAIPYKSITAYYDINTKNLREQLIILKNDTDFGKDLTEGRLDLINALIDFLVGTDSLTQDSFYNGWYQFAANNFRDRLRELDNDIEDDDNNKSNDGSQYALSYVVGARFRLAEYNQWKINYQDTESYAYNNDQLSVKDKTKFEQYLEIFKYFLTYAEQNQIYRQESSRYTNPITVYNQQYSTVDAISNNTDKNQQWINVNIPGLYGDSGAAAFFAIEDTQAIPIGTRKVRISFEFNNTSETYSDQNPEVKDWAKQDIYVDLYGNTDEEKSITQVYGAPRCGITSIKYVLYPNKITTGPTYKSYLIPTSSVWYEEKAKLNQNIHNSTNQLVYNTTQINNITPISL